MSNDIQREVALFFAGNTMTFHCRPEDEERWRSAIDEAIAKHERGDGASILRAGSTVFIIGQHFVGYQIRDRGSSPAAQAIKFQERLLQSIDPDADEPWKQSEE